MKIVSHVQPLVFSFGDMDRMLEAMSRAKEKNCALSFYRGRYYLTVYSPFRTRRQMLRTLCEYGSFHGIGMVLDAFVAEHGRRIREYSGIKNKSLTAGAKLQNGENDNQS